MRSPLARILAAGILTGAAVAALAQPVTFDAVAPLLAARCAMCHAGPAAAADLRLDSLEGLLKGSRSGPVVKSARPAESELVRRIKGSSQPRMPMTGPPFLSDDEIGLVERWVASGMPPGEAAATTATPPAARPERPAASVPTYADVAPIFATRCAKCHADNGLMGPPPEGYVLTSYASTLAIADRARIVAGSAAASEVVRRIRGSARPRMPLDGPPYLSEAEIALIAGWIDAGAPDGSGARAARPSGAPVRLHGMLRPDWKLDELGLLVPVAARFDRAATVGAYVEVRGRVGDDGAIVAERIKPR